MSLAANRSLNFVFLTEYLSFIVYYPPSIFIFVSSPRSSSLQERKWKSSFSRMMKYLVSRLMKNLLPKHAVLVEPWP